MPLYRKKPLDVEAMLFDGSAEQLMDVFHWVEANTQGIFDPFSSAVPSGSGVNLDMDGSLLISTLDGIKRVKKGPWWVVKVSDGQFDVVPHETFVAENETVDGSAMPEPEPIPDPEPVPDMGEV